MRSTRSGRRTASGPAVCTVVAAVFAVVAGKNADLVAWVGLFTTAGATFAAYVLANKYDKLAATYSRTSTQLDRLIDHRSIHPVTPESEAEFVRRVEEVLDDQNEGWVVLLRS
jgi:SMODS and SLOG-associating 2TM effector domain 1